MTQATLKERIRQDMLAARRQQDRDRARLLSTLLSDIHNREIELGGEADDPAVVEVLARALKIRNEAAEQMASRPELAERERGEAAAVMEYMPAQLGEEQIRAKVAEVIEAGPANLGAVMGRVMPQLKGQADGREVNRIVREELAAREGGD